MIAINEIKMDQLDVFLEYLVVHLSENGKGGNLLFQPLSQEQSKSIHDWKDKFEAGLTKRFGEMGSRKLWIATNEDNAIVGHIDIRFYNELNTAHRVLLGMGVDSKFRKMRIGQSLLEFVIRYCKKQPEINWLDLQVLALNTPAICLYEKMEFQKISTTTDMFRINHVSYDYTSMTLNVNGN